jgi:hypothetical protein
MAVLAWPNLCAGVGTGVFAMVSYVWDAHPVRWQGMVLAFIEGFALGAIGSGAFTAIFEGLGEGVVWLAGKLGRSWLESIGRWFLRAARIASRAGGRGKFSLSTWFHRFLGF